MGRSTISQTLQLFHTAGSIPKKLCAKEKAFSGLTTVSRTAAGVSPTAAVVLPTAAVVSPTAAGVSPTAAGVSPTAAGVRLLQLVYHLL